MTGTSKHTYFMPLVVQAEEPYPFSKKRGVSITSGTDPRGVAAVGASWYHNWSPDPTEGVDPSIVFVPTAWAGEVIQTRSRVQFWANEPNNRGQAGANDKMYNPESAARMYQAAYKKHKKAVLPAGVCTPDDGWFDKFLNALVRLGVPLPEQFHVHGYAEKILNVDAEYLFRFWERLHKLLPEPANCVVTEFGSTNGDMGIMREMLAFLDATPWVIGYAAFSLRIDEFAKWYPGHWPHPCKMHLVTPNGELTPLGRVYAGI